MTSMQDIICPHGPCTCVVSEPGTHCSAACAAHDGAGCGCGHTVCQAFAGRDVDQDALDPHTVGESMEAPGTGVDATEE